MGSHPEEVEGPVGADVLGDLGRGDVYAGDVLDDCLQLGGVVLPVVGRETLTLEQLLGVLFYEVMPESMIEKIGGELLNATSISAITISG